jgi:hypothetical protein
MGKVNIQHGIGYSAHSGAQYIDMAAAKALEPAQPIQQTAPYDVNNTQPWSPWGADNLLPQQMTVDIETTGILNSIIEGRARFATCQGMIPAIVHTNEKGEKIIEKIVDDPEIMDFLEMNNHFLHVFGWMKDYIGFHRCIGRFMLDPSRKKIAAFQRDDITETRLSKKKDGKIESVWYSGDWSKAKYGNNDLAFSKPLLNPLRPYLDLQQRLAKGDKRLEYAVTVAHPSWGKQYYPTPLWYAAYKWVKIAQGVPEMKAAMFENNMRLKYLVIIQESYWGKAFKGWDAYTKEAKEEARQKVYDQIDEYLVGSKNAYKSFFTTGYRDRDGKTWADVQIQPIEDTTKPGELLPDSAAANSEIAFASLFNPAIIGASLPSGPYTNSQGGSNVRESVLVQIVLHELERQQIRSIMNVPKYFNGWNLKHPGLDFIIPATVLTTLDTGAGTKQVVMGGTGTGDSKQ